MDNASQNYNQGDNSYDEDADKMDDSIIFFLLLLK